MRFLKLAVIAASLLAANAVLSAAETPKSVLHIITLRYKAGSSEADKAKVIDATKKLAAAYPGITRLWFKKIKVQVEGMSDIIVMEFKDQAAFDAYGPAKAHKDWEAVYLPLRDSSNTQDVTN